jgi:hypothetical protein
MSPEQIAILTKRAASGEPAVTFEFTPFAPGTAGEITGAPTDYQKFLRRHGLLTHTDGHARFDVFGLAMLMVVRMMGDRGGPTAVVRSKLAKNVGYHVAWHALSYNHAYAGDHEQTLMWDSALAPQIESWQAATAQLRHRSDWSREEALEELRRAVTDPEVRSFNGWERQSLWLREKMFRLRGFRDVPVPRFTVWAPDGRTATCPSLDLAFTADEQRPNPQMVGPVVVFDLPQLAWKLLTDMKRVTGGEFVTVHIAPMKGKQP